MEANNEWYEEYIEKPDRISSTFQSGKFEFSHNVPDKSTPGTHPAT